MAEFVKWPLENVYTLNEEALLKEQGYSITDLPLLQTLMIPYGGLADAGVQVGDTVIVAPATGKFGAAAVLVALSMGAMVIACGRSEENLQKIRKSIKAVSAGRLRTLAWSGNSDKDTDALKLAVGDRGADVYIDFSPPAAGADGRSPSHMSLAIAALTNGGTCVLMGGLAGKIELPYMLLMFSNIVVRGNFMYQRAQALQLIKMAENGLLKLGLTVNQRVEGPYGLDRIQEALERASELPGWGRSVVVAP